MQLKLKLLSTANFMIGNLETDIDLFDAQGLLLLAKGNSITSHIMELLKNRELYIIEYQWKQEQILNRSFSPETYKKILGSIQRIYFDAHLVNLKTLRNTMEIVDEIINELEEYETFSEEYKIYVDFNRFRTHDNYTYVHSVNVAILATLIGSQIGYWGKYLHNLCLGALLHDIGKLMIPASILQKPSGLTPEEFEIVKRHSIYGQEMLRNVGVPSEVLFAIRQHHERWNGQGYPDRLMKQGIHPSAQIVAVADVFDALTADRPYRKGLPPYHALEMIIAVSGTDFSPDVVEAFRRSLVLYPKNSIVTLNTGEVGSVISVPDNNPTRPLVRILFDKWGNFVNDYVIVNLLQDLTSFINEVEFNVG
ncbi:MAG: HD-GYP domain-containing protein [Desulfitobacteriaceae bacterium]